MAIDTLGRGLLRRTTHRAWTTLRTMASALHWRMMCIGLALGVLACAHRSSRPIASRAPPGPPAPLELRQRYAGTYVFVGGDQERAAVAAAVERAVAPMSIFAIDIARQALLARAEPRTSYSLTFDAGYIKVESPGEFPEVSPWNGTPVYVVNRFGDGSELTQQFVEGALVQRGRTDDGGGSTTFELQPDGRTLLVRKVMESTQLPRRVEYTLTYRRQ